MKVLRSDKKGFTLVEVLISAAILGIVLISLLGIFVVGKSGSAKAKHHMQAMNHARAAMEQYIHDGTIYSLPDGDIESLGGSCSVVPSGTGIKTVTVTVSWTPPRWEESKDVKEELVTLISE